MHSIAAKRSTRRAQIAVVALGVAAGALAMLPVGSAHGDSDVGAPGKAVVGTPKVRPIDPAPDVSEMVSALGSIAPPAPKIEKPDATVAGTDDKDNKGLGAVVSAAPVVAWRYIGSITNADYRRAIVVVGDKQRLVAENDTIDGSTKLVHITSEYLVVKDGDAAEREVELAPRQLLVPTIISASGRSAGAGGNGGKGDATGKAGEKSAGVRAKEQGEEEDSKEREQVRMKEEMQRRAESARLRDAHTQRRIEQEKAKQNGARPPANGGKPGPSTPPPNPKTPEAVQTPSNVLTDRPPADDPKEDN